MAGSATYASSENALRIRSISASWDGRLASTAMIRHSCKPTHLGKLGGLALERVKNILIFVVGHEE